MLLEEGNDTTPEGWLGGRRPKTWEFLFLLRFHFRIRGAINLFRASPVIRSTFAPALIELLEMGGGIESLRLVEVRVS